MTVTVRNAQTDREAPLGPAYTLINSEGVTVPCPNPQASCDSIDLQALAPSEGPAYFAPGHSIHLPYESQWVMPQTLDPYSMRWLFVTAGDGTIHKFTGVYLDVPHP
jgi:hypothetical protein